MRDTIDRQATVDAIKEYWKAEVDAIPKDTDFEKLTDIHDLILKYAEGISRVLESIPLAEAAPRWRPFKQRPATKEEKEMHPNWDVILEGELPEEGQRIMVTVKYDDYRTVYEDVYYDGESYLDSGYEIGKEAIAWMPLPAPYRGGEDATD